MIFMPNYFGIIHGTPILDMIEEDNTNYQILFNNPYNNNQIRESAFKF
jgi:hypothetical protein